MCAPMALGLVSAGVSMVGSIAAANAQAAGLKSQAAWQRRQANVEQMKTSFSIQQQRRAAKAEIAGQTLYFAGAGIQSGTGTPTDVAMATTQAREMDIQARRIQGSEESERLRFEAASNESAASGVQTAGFINALSTGISAAGNLFSGSVSGTSMTNNAFKVGALQTAPAAPSVATQIAPSAVPKIRLDAAGRILGGI